MYGSQGEGVKVGRVCSMFLNRQFIIMSQWARNSIFFFHTGSSSLFDCVTRGLTARTAEECKLLKVTLCGDLLGKCAKKNFKM